VEKVNVILDWAKRHEIELRLARLKITMKTYLERDWITERRGEDRIYGNVFEAAADKTIDPDMLDSGSDCFDLIVIKLG